MEHDDAEYTMDGENPRVSLTLEVSDAMEKLYTEHLGRGPATKARADWAGADVLISTLRETFTPAERMAVEMGEHQRLRDARLSMQHMADAPFIAAIERIVGRKVAALVSGVNVTKDISSEVFYFEPRPNDA